VVLGQGLRDVFVWEILGRMCHLIQDMSVPAHTRCDEHGLFADEYENWVSEDSRWTYWNANNCGTLLNPYVSSNPIHYLMYTTQQIANHFGSSGPYCSVGNNVIGGNPLPEEVTYLNSINLSSLGDPMGQGPFYVVTEENIRNKTLPQAIRATAGLLYWFAHEAGIIPTPCIVYNNRTFEFDQSESIPQNGFTGNPMTISAPDPLVKNGKTYRFAGWNDGSWESNTRIVYPTGNETYTANYKVVHLSNDINAFVNTSQRKLVRTPDGWLHQVYTSSVNGVMHAWIEHSSNNGDSWALGNGGRPLDYYFGGNLSSKCPSVDYYTYQGSNNRVAVVFQQKESDGHYSIQFLSFYLNNGQWESEVPQWIYTDDSQNYSSVDANPNISFSGLNDFLVTFEHSSAGGTPGIYCMSALLDVSNGSSGGEVTGRSEYCQIPGTDGNSSNASVSNNKSSSTHTYSIAWQ